MTDANQDQTPASELNRIFQKNFLITNTGLMVINVNTQLCITEEQQQELLENIHQMSVTRRLGENPSLMEKLLLAALADSKTK